jgi:NADPH-dependent glutamate synthase beta subunit-like oxidoreductase
MRWHYDLHVIILSVFAAGDARSGQSLVVWAINEGRGVETADGFLNQWLASLLPHDKQHYPL